MLLPQLAGGPLEDAGMEEEVPITELSGAEDEETPATEDELVSVELEASREEAAAAELLSTDMPEDGVSEDEEVPNDDGAWDVPLAGALVTAWDEEGDLEEEPEPPDDEPPDDEPPDEEDDEEDDELDPLPVHATRDSPAHNDASRHALP
jgi:hypothetical protein